MMQDAIAATVTTRRPPALPTSQPVDGVATDRTDRNTKESDAEFAGIQSQLLLHCRYQRHPCCNRRAIDKEHRQDGTARGSWAGQIFPGLSASRYHPLLTGDARARTRSETPTVMRLMRSSTW